MKKNATALLLLIALLATPAGAGGLADVAASSEAVRRLRADVTFLSSDALKGRRAGTAEADEAARFVADSFQRIGLLPGAGRGGYLQTFDFLDGVTLGPKNALRTTGDGARTFTPSAEFRPLAFSAAGQVSGPVVFVGYGIASKDPAWDDYEGIDVKGRIVLALRYGPDGDDQKSPFSPYAALRYKASAAREHGAAALLVATGPLTKDVQDELVALRTDAAFSDAGVPVVSVKRDVAEALFAGSGTTLEEAQRAIAAAKRPVSKPLSLGAELVVDVTPRRVKSSNVVGLLPGSDPALASQTIVVGAHYDHLGLGGAGSLEAKEGSVHHGADDNASGVAALLEIARSLVKKRGALKRSILFAAFGAEEEGTLGSLHFVKDPSVPIADVVAMVNLDMVGRLRDDRLDVHGLGTSPVWKPIVDEANAPLRLKLTIHPGGFGPSDHASFYAAKKPVLFVFTGNHADYHKSTDTADKLNLEGEVKVVRLLEPVVESVANAPERPTFTEVKGETPPSPSRGFRVWVGGIPDYSEEGTGVKLSGVTSGSPAEAAGMKAGDAIVKFGDKEIRNIYDYTYALQGRKPGEKVAVVVKRIENGTQVEKSLEVTLGTRPDAAR